MKNTLRAALCALLLSLPILSCAAGEPATHTGKVAIITGSSYGLGRELALLAHAAGMQLVLVDMRPEPSRALARQFNEDGGKAIFVEADLAVAAQRAPIIAAALETYGRIDMLFNNAGYSYAATHEQMELDAAHHIFEVNYWAYADLAQRVIGPMRAAGGGVIVNIASILGVSPSPPGLGHYGATKHALLGLFQTTAQELAPDNIQVIIAAPAGMKTRISLHSTGPLADPSVDRAANWEDPAIPARDIFDAIGGDEVVIYPGYIGRT